MAKVFKVTWTEEEKKSQDCWVWCDMVLFIIIIIKCIFIAQNRIMQLMRSIDSHTANKNVFSLCLNVSTEMSGARRSAGRLFHVRGPCTAKLRSP